MSTLRQVACYALICGRPPYQTAQSQDKLCVKHRRVSWEGKNEGGNKGPGWKSQWQLSKEFSWDRKDGWDWARHKMSFLPLDSRPGICDRATGKDSVGCALPEGGQPRGQGGWWNQAQALGWGSAQRKGHLFLVILSLATSAASPCQHSDPWAAQDGSWRLFQISTQLPFSTASALPVQNQAHTNTSYPAEAQVISTLQ